MKTEDKPKKEKDKKIILWEVNSFPVTAHDSMLFLGVNLLSREGNITMVRFPFLFPG